jgi:SAM-dependent methyltransferase
VRRDDEVEGPPADDETLLPDALRADRRPFSCCDIYDAPDWYDVDYAAYRGEVAFYRSLVQRHAGSGVVVELGAGTGRLTTLLAADGVRLHAVEPQAAMRDALERKLTGVPAGRVTVEAACGASFAGPAGEAVSVVFFAFNGLLHVAGRAALDACVRHVRARLDVDGRFAFDVTSPYWETMQRGRVPWGRIDERVHPRSGRRFLTADRSRYDPETRTTHVDIRYAYVDGDEPGVQTSLRQFMWTYPELLAALERHGFAVDEAWGDVDFAPADDGAPRLLVVGRRIRP